MIDPYFKQQNFIPQQTGVTWQTVGYSSMGLDVAGSFTAGSFTLEGTNDGATWTTLKASKDAAPVTGGIVSSTGHYTFSIIGYNVVRFTASTSPALNASLTLSALGTTQVAVLEN